MFTLGCNNLIISTDHCPLLGIFNNKELNSINSPQLCNLKEKTLKFKFNMQYNPGKWHRGPDACSANPTLPAPKLPETNIMCCIIADSPTMTDIYNCEQIENTVEVNLNDSIETFNCDTNTDNKIIITKETIAKAYNNNPQYQLLVKTIRSGFPTTKNQLES